MKLSHPSLAAVLLAITIATPGASQSLPEGYDHTLDSLPANAGNVLWFSPGITVWFDGSNLVLHGLASPLTLLSFPMPVFGSFTLRVGQAHVLFGENSTGGIWLVSPNGPPPTQPLANLPFNYDAVPWNAHSVIVSAKTSGFSGPDNDLLTLDLQTGATQLLAQLPGASGPVAVDGHGDLYYATASLGFPTPPGTTTVLRFPRLLVDQAIANQQVLGIAHAQVVLAGLDSAADLAFDSDGDLFFVDWFNAAIGEVDDADAAYPSAKTLLAYGAASFSGSGLQFVRSTNQGVFEPFQSIGQTLRVHETSFGSLSQVRTVSPRPATLGTSVPTPIPAGPFALQVTNGPANGLGLIAIALPHSPWFVQVNVPGFEQPLAWHQALLQPANTHFVSFDAAGIASLPLVNPGFAPALGILTQAAFVDALGATIGATGARPVVLGP